jgi:hypothetical protein
MKIHLTNETPLTNVLPDLQKKVVDNLKSTGERPELLIDHHRKYQYDTLIS